MGEEHTVGHFPQDIYEVALLEIHLVVLITRIIMSYNGLGAIPLGVNLFLGVSGLER